MRRLAICLLIVVMGLAACGDDDSATSVPTTSTPLATTAAPTTTAPAPTTAAPTTTTPAATTTIAPTTTTTTSTTTTLPPGPQDITLQTADAVTLEGRQWPGGTTWVVLGHMRPSDMTSWFGFAEVVAGEGFSALVYNARGYGNSEGDGFEVGTDALAAITFAREHGATGVIYIGASMNGAAAVFAAAEEDLLAIAALSAVPEFFGTQGLARAPEVTEPSLFVAAEDDGNAAADAEAYADAVAGPSETVVYPTGGHGTSMFENPDLETILLEFVVTHG